MGGGGGGGGHTPYEAPESGRSKQAVRIVEIVSEGEVKGLVNGVQSVFLDNTPIQNKDGTYNFSNVEAEGRIGIQDQDILEGFNTSEKEISVGTQVRKNTPLTRTVSDGKVSRLRLTLGVQSLFSQNDQGDTHGASVTMNITIGQRVIPLTINGKYSSQYLRQIEIDNLPPTPFTVRVERIDEDSKSQRLQNNTIWASYTEIIETQLAYPNTALVGIKFDSDYFSSIPNRTYEVYGIIVQVPSNYDPQTRTYTGIWDGTFKAAWSDNPAWVLYDLLKNKRYGFGRRLGDFAVDKWALYNVARYCDQLVDDGFGGKEPRFTCNAWMTEQRQAYDVINDICSIFRAIPVWNGREFTVIQDRHADPVWTYTNANVEKGEFTYSYSAMKARHNEIHVEYANAQNNYEKDVICVSDDDLIRRYGLNVKKVTAFGCTSRGQAYRTGRWILETEKLETRTVTFSVGAEGLMHVPGDIILVADNDYAGTQIGGRVISIDRNTVTIDREAQFKVGDKFMFYNQAAEVVSVKVAEVLAGNKLRLEVPPTGLTEYGVWLRHGDKIQPQLYRALSIKEERNGKYTITALQHEPQKEAIVDSGAHFEQRSYSSIQRPKVGHVNISTTSDGGVSVDAYVSSGQGVVKYDIRIYKNGALYNSALGQSSPNISANNLPNGDYSVVIQAKDQDGRLLDEKTESFTIDKPPVPTGVRFSGGLGTITIEWDWVDGSATEIFVADVDDITKATRIAKVTARTFTHEVGGKQVRYYWLRHTKGVNVGPFYQQTGLRAESSVDIDAELKLLNDELKKTLQGSFEAIVEVNNKTYSPYINIGKYIYHSDKNQFFVWGGAKYEPVAVEAEKIVGKLTAMQIATNAIQAQHLAANSVTTAKIATGAVTANEIATGAVGAKHVATQSLDARHIATKSLTANLLKVDSLSAVSANLGSVTAGSLKIGKLNGNFGTMFEVQSSGGFRLIARDATGGIELNSASRALHVWDGAKEAVRVGKL
jgi:predicted phage tail protein